MEEIKFNIEEKLRKSDCEIKCEKSKNPFIKNCKIECGAEKNSLKKIMGGKK